MSLPQHETTESLQFYQACQLGDLDQVKSLLDRSLTSENFDPNWQNPSIFGNSTTAIHVACINGMIDVVNHLLTIPEIEVNVGDSEGNSPLHLSCIYGNLEIARLLLGNERVDPALENGEGSTPFHLACQEGKAEVVAMLLRDPRIDVNHPNKEKRTPLCSACKFGREQVVRFLLDDDRVLLNQVDDNSRTPFWIACMENHPRIVEMLLRDGRIDVNHGSPFLHACRQVVIQVMKLLLSSNRIEVQRPGEGHPLWIAGESMRGLPRKVVAIDILLKNPRIKTYKDDFPENLQPLNLLMTRERRYMEIERYIASGKELRLPQNFERVPILMEFVKNPDEVRKKLRKKLGWTTNEAMIFAYMIFACDGIFDIKETGQTVEEERMIRFLKIAYQLHLDVQMQLANRSAGSSKTYISFDDRELAFSGLAKSLGYKTTKSKKN